MKMGMSWRDGSRSVTNMKKKEKTSAATTALFTALRSANYNTTLQKKDITLVIIATPTPPLTTYMARDRLTTLKESWL